MAVELQRLAYTSPEALLAVEQVVYGARFVGHPTGGRFESTRCGDPATDRGIRKPEVDPVADVHDVSAVSLVPGFQERSLEELLDEAQPAPASVVAVAVTVALSRCAVSPSETPVK